MKLAGARLMQPDPLPRRSPLCINGGVFEGLIGLGYATRLGVTAVRPDSIAQHHVLARLQRRAPTA